MLKTIAIVIVVAIAAILGYATLRPDDFRVQRSVTIKAPPEKIFALIDDFHAWGSWSPFEQLDPGMKRSFSGAASGKGAAYAWDSTGKAGAGSMEIKESTPPSKILIKLDFTKPLEGHNTAEFSIDTQGDSSKVTWAMYGPSPYVAKVMGIFFSMDNMIGKDFETGLATLKSVAEK
ncbi:SRPBCC family protein [Collimonas pratensis]|uniref:Polyketide cyclase / dehydrase and lipid transport family protein n=1 Tax=Collimonas pratensis TaxID=279113 RepID=A0A127Q960_9BURK|nr:SRPBCC family protein [Collimonas pratensis]AMP06395.1 polyketide cyclase / dehydrase and lipid transport family protein [Collimonas pratensis]